MTGTRAAQLRVPDSSVPDRAVLPVALGVFAALVAVVLAAAVTRTGGRLVYTLDDPYIHLALAREIAHGHYGLNPGEAAAPSSSILWPFLLAPLARTAVAEWVPFALGIASGALALVSLDGLLRRQFAEALPGLRLLLLLLAIVVLSPVVAAFSGMEHGLQVWLTVAGIAGLAERPSGRPVPWWGWAALVAGPFVRYENLAVSVPALVYLFGLGERRAATASLAVITGGLAAFSGALLMSGLGALPSSVLVKQAAASRGISGVVGSLTETLTDPQGVLLAVGALVLGGVALSPSRSHEARGLAGVGVAVVALHALAGGYVYRYVVYATAAVGLVLLVLYGPDLAARWRRGAVGAAALVVATAAVVGAPYAYFIAEAPLAAQNVYEQQGQMARFVAEAWRRPVAVNDLGLVAWRSPAPVLDLIGLGSYPVVRAWKTDPTGAWVGPLVRSRGVDLALVYTEWFPALPASWTRVGTLRLSGPNVALGGPAVDAYATRPEAVAAVTEALRRFQPTLPPGVTLEIADL